MALERCRHLSLAVYITAFNSTAFLIKMKIIRKGSFLHFAISQSARTFFIWKYELNCIVSVCTINTLSEKKVLSRTLKGSSAQCSAGTFKGSR